MLPEIDDLNLPAASWNLDENASRSLIVSFLRAARPAVSFFTFGIELLLSFMPSMRVGVSKPIGIVSLACLTSRRKSYG
jgi:hypothetical protein